MASSAAVTVTNPEPTTTKLGYWRDLTPEQLTWVENRCRPGPGPDRVCSAGMLAPDETLRDVLEQDEATLERLGITRFQIADVLEAALESAKERWSTRPDTGTLTLGDTKYRIESTQYMGCQESPFDLPHQTCHLPHSHRNVTVYNAEDEVFHFGGLLPHLIRQHGFFEGNAHTTTYKFDGITSFRVDPEECVRFFDIQPGHDYRSDLARAKAMEVRLLANPYNFFKYSQDPACYHPVLEVKNR